jgi:asparagine synthase (glutamine-hydrolysing)
MSAINGVLIRKGPPLAGAQLAASSAALCGYGQDGSSHWVAGTVAFGHQRTIDVLEDRLESLPWYDSSSQQSITADARIDNREELCESLGIPASERGRTPSSHLIRGAWERWGRDCPRHIVGDFAFAIWDAPNQTLFFARDHIGARSLYYSLTSDRVIFATDIKGVLAVPGVSDRLDEDYVTAVLADKRFYHQSRTYFEAIRKLPPGHTLTVQPGQERVERYWSPEAARDVRFARDEDYIHATRDLYVTAVRDRLSTDRRVAVHLSGGLDSSSVTALVNRELRRQGKTSPVVLTGQSVPDDARPRSVEHSRLAAVCASEGLTPLYCPPNAGDVLNVLEKDPAREPMHGTSPFEVSLQRRAASEGVRLILSGWGGDEGLSFNGRGHLGGLLLRGRIRELFRQAKYCGSPARLIAREALLLLFPDRTEALRKLKARSLRSQTLASSFIHPDLQGRVKLHRIPCRQASIHSTLSWMWTCGCLGARMESWSALGAPQGLLYAYPMLDRRLLEFIAGLPPEQFVRGRWRRRLLRKTMEGILPEEICWQPDKLEPLRAEAGMTAYHNVFEIARQRLLAAKESPSRARYLDFPRLLDSMRPERLAMNPRPADISGALQFLDF